MPRNYVASYVHSDGIAGALVELSVGDITSAKTAELQDLGRELAMHITAMAPRVVNPSQLNIDEWNAELSRLSSSASIARLPPAERVEALRAARERYERDFCLLKQPFVKDESLTVEDRISRTAGALGERIEVLRFARFASFDRPA